VAALTTKLEELGKQVDAKGKAKRKEE